MPEKGLVNYSWITWAWVWGLSLLGGAAAYLNQIGLEQRRFRPAEFGAKLVVSGFVGMVAFIVSEAAGVPPLWGSAAVGMSGYVGSGAVDVFKLLVFRKIRISADERKDA